MPEGKSPGVRGRLQSPEGEGEKVVTKVMTLDVGLKGGLGGLSTRGQ